MCGLQNLRDRLVNKPTPIRALTCIKNILIEEKIDGTNAQIEFAFNKLVSHKPVISICGRNRVIGDKDDNFVKETITKNVNLRDIEDWYYINHCRDKEGKIKDDVATVKIYGEVYGYRLQKNLYTPKNIRDFIVFDIQIGNCWLSPSDRNILCKKLNLKSVPTIGMLVEFPPLEVLHDMLHRTNHKSWIAFDYGRDSILEGYILRPQISMSTNGGRVIGKIKVKDFRTKQENRKIDRGE